MAPKPRPASEAEIERDLCMLVHQFARTLDAAARRAGEELGLTATQVVALRELNEPLTARDLAARMSCEAPNATFVVDRLEEQGLIERRPHPTDRRAKQIVLTATGRRRRAEALQRLSDQSPLNPLTTAQQESLRSLLRMLVTQPEANPRRHGRPGDPSHPPG